MHALLRALLIDAGPLIALLTLDQKDFNIYRLPRKGRFTLLP
jgi:hypothetical protein